MANETTQTDQPTTQQVVPEAQGTSSSTTMHVKVYSPFHVYFDGQAESISAENATGQFDILPRHKSFLTLLNPCDVVVRGSGKEEKVPITTGIMHVKADEVVVFLDV